jgi:hypothetical protein
MDEAFGRAAVEHDFKVEVFADKALARLRRRRWRHRVGVFGEGVHGGGVQRE